MERRAIGNIHENFSLNGQITKMFLLPCYHSPYLCTYDSSLFHEQWLRSQSCPDFGTSLPWYRTLAAPRWEASLIALIPPLWAVSKGHMMHMTDSNHVLPLPEDSCPVADICWKTPEIFRETPLESPLLVIKYPSLPLRLLVLQQSPDWSFKILFSVLEC